MRAFLILMSVNYLDRALMWATSQPGECLLSAPSDLPGLGVVLVASNGFVAIWALRLLAGAAK